MTRKSEMDTTTKLYSIAEQLKAIGKEGLQHYVNEWNKLQHEKLVELGFRLWRILDEVPLSQSDESIQTVNPGIDFSNELKKISNDLKTINDTGRKNYLNPYVERRYETTSRLYAEINSILNEKSLSISTDFGNVRDVTTPLIGAEAAVFIDGKLLLIQRNDVGLWAVPGGGVDVGNTLSEAALRELEEETRLRGSVKRLLGFFDSRLWESKLKNQTFHVIFEVNVEEGEPEKTIETLDYGFFGKDELPHLSPGHDARVPFLFELVQDESRIPYYD